jgi:hypothetical protein
MYFHKKESRICSMWYKSACRSNVTGSCILNIGNRWGFRGCCDCFIYMINFLRLEVVRTSPNPQARGTPLVGCPRLLIQYTRSYHPHLKTVSPRTIWGLDMPWWQRQTWASFLSKHRQFSKFGHSVNRGVAGLGKGRRTGASVLRGTEWGGATKCPAKWMIYI